MSTVDSAAGSQVRSFPFSQPDQPVLDPMFGDLRRDEPMSRVQLPYGDVAWLATRYEDIRFVLSDPRFSRERANGPGLPRLMPEPPEDQGSILGLDPPDHTRLRKLVAKAFTARRVEALRPRIQDLVSGLLAAMAAQGPPADLVSALALPLPVAVICEVLGVPYADRDRFRDWTEHMVSLVPSTQPAQVAARDALAGYLTGLVVQYRKEPNGSILSALVEASDGGDRLSEMELVSLAMTLLIAGHETTANQIGNFMWVLFQHPDQYRRLRRDPGLVGTAVEELLRYMALGTETAFPRVATEDLLVGDVLVRAGEPVLVPVASANRDERAFDRPDELDLGRQVNPHVAFGHGVHHCLGAQLARAELQEALRGLLDRFPDLAPAVPLDEVPWRHQTFVRGPRALPVTW
jgi:cytochrome P450